MKQTPFYYTLRRLLALSVMSLLTLGILSLTSCRHKGSEHDDYGLSAALSWADPSDAGREIKNVRIWIFQAGGKLVAKRQYGSKFLIALDIHPLPVGEYDVVATTNLIEPFGAEGDETFSSLQLKLREASTSAEHAHYAVGHISLPKDRNSRIGLSLRRILSELTVEVEGAPRGTKLETMVLNAADVRSAIAALAEIVREEILAGRSVALADLGSFRVVSTGKRMATEKEVTADTLKAPRIQFLPKMEMRNLTKSIQRVVLRPGEAELTPENPLD